MGLYHCVFWQIFLLWLFLLGSCPFRCLLRCPWEGETQIWPGDLRLAVFGGVFCFLVFMICLFTCDHLCPCCSFIDDSLFSCKDRALDSCQLFKNFNNSIWKFRVPASLALSLCQYFCSASIAGFGITGAPSLREQKGKDWPGARAGLGFVFGTWKLMWFLETESGASLVERRREQEGKRARGQERMWRCEDEKMWGCEDVKMWREGEKIRCEDEKIRCEDEKMWGWEDLKMRKCEDVQMWRWEDVRMSRWENVKMWGCEGGGMWRCEDEKMLIRGSRMSRPSYGYWCRAMHFWPAAWRRELNRCFCMRGKSKLTQGVPSMRTSS